MDESERLVALAALAPPEAAVAAWKRWRATTDIADATGLLSWAGGYIHRNLLAAGVDDPYLAGIYRYNLISNNRKVIAALPVIRALSARTSLTPLKSFGMSAEHYSRGLRPLADVDFFVPAADVDRAHEILVEHGLRPLLGISRTEFATRALPHRGSWNYLDDSGTDLDLHWRIFEHLETGENERLVAENSDPEETEFGRVRRLRPELMLLGLIVHHAQSTGPANGLFDAAHLLRGVDVARAAALARRIGVERETAAVCDAIRGIVGDLAPVPVLELERRVAPRARRQGPHQAMVRRPPVFERDPRRYREAERSARPVAARVWVALGRPGWLERRLLGATGTLGRSLDDPQPYEPGVPLYPETSGELGIGWHHLFPGDPFRWAHGRDIRVTFRDLRPGLRTLRIELDPPNWQGSPRGRFEVIAAGRWIGTCDSSAATFEFPLEVTAPTVEVSLRVRGLRRFRAPGAQQKWYRMLAPVRLIDVR